MPNTTNDRHLSLLSQLTGHLTQTDSFARSISDALPGIVEALNAEAGSLFLLTPERHRLICKASVGPVNLVDLSLPADKGVIGHAVKNAETRVSYRTDEDFVGHVDQRTGFETRSLLTTPLRAGTEVVGAIQLVNSLDEQFSDADKTTLEILAATTGLAIANKRYTEQMLEHEAYETELGLARDIRRAMMTASAQGPTANVHLPGKIEQRDFCAVVHRPDGTTHFCIAEVKGLSSGAGLLTGRLATLWHYLIKLSGDPCQILQTINNELAEHSGQRRLISVIVGVRRGNRVTFANAGHAQPICDGLDSDAPSLAVGATEWRDSPHAFELDLTRTRAIFYSAGAGRLLAGELGMTWDALLAQTTNAPPKTVCETVQRLAHRSAFEDDVSVVAFGPSNTPSAVTPKPTLDQVQGIGTGRVLAH